MKPIASPSADPVAATSADERRRSHLALLQAFFRYLLVGGLAFLVDWGVLTLGVSFGMDYRVATALGFVFGLITNYLLCIAWVWRGTQARTLRDIVIFTLIGVGGLGLTELLMWLAVDLAALRPSIAKLPIAGIVLVWNFGLRRLFVFFH